ncbi:MAG: hypothetical protein ACOC1O_02170 [bacterium]
MTINAWKEYEKYAEELTKEMINKGFDKDRDPDCFASDAIIGSEVGDGVEFEKIFKNELKRQGNM